MPPHQITLENYDEAQEAVRDILMLYVDMAESYSGFGHAVDVNVRFDPLKYVDAEVVVPEGYAPPVDIDLLRTGSAIAALCYLYDLWCEFDMVDVPSGSAIKTGVEAGRLSLVPDVEAVAREALRRNKMPQDDPWFDEAVEPIYERHVIGYFERLSRMHRRARRRI